MNSYILLGLLCPLMWAGTNYLDKFLLSKVEYPTKYVIPVLLIFSSLIGSITGIITFILGYSEILSLSLGKLGLLIGMGMMGILAIYFYLLALNKDIPTNVVPFFQLMPIFALFIGYYFFSEEILGLNLLGVILVVIGSMLLSLNLKTFHINITVLGLIGLSGLIFTLRDAFFRILYTENSYIVSIFGLSLGLLISGCLLLCIKKFRKGFFDTISKNGIYLVGLNTMNEVLNMGAVLIFLYISTYVYLAHLELLNSLQPLFILMIGFVLYKISPDNFGDSRSHEEIGKQILSVLIMLVGVYLVTI